jgi:hypothetical protein
MAGILGEGEGQRAGALTADVIETDTRECHVKETRQIMFHT